MALREQLHSIGLAFVLVVGTGIHGVADAQGRVQQVVVLDECDPTTFNDAAGPGTCLNVTGGKEWLFPPFSRRCPPAIPSGYSILLRSVSHAGIRCARSTKAGKFIPLRRWRSSVAGSFLG